MKLTKVQVQKDPKPLLCEAECGYIQTPDKAINKTSGIRNDAGGYCISLQLTALKDQPAVFKFPGSQVLSGDPQIQPSHVAPHHADILVAVHLHQQIPVGCIPVKILGFRNPITIGGAASKLAQFGIANDCSIWYSDRKNGGA